MTDPFGGMPPPMPPPEPHHPDPPPPPSPDPGMVPPPMPPDPGHHDPGFFDPGFHDPGYNPAFDPNTMTPQYMPDPNIGYAPLDPPAYFPDPPAYAPDPPGYFPDPPAYAPDPPAYFPDPPPVDNGLAGLGDPYAPPEPPGFEPYIPPEPPGFADYVPPEPPGFAEYIPPEPPGFADYIPPEPPGFEPYTPPEPPGFADYAPPEPPGLDIESGDARDAFAPTAAAGGGQASPILNFGIPEHHAEETITSVSYQASDFQPQRDGSPTTRIVEINDGPNHYTAYITSSLDPTGQVMTISITMGGEAATVVIPAAAAHDVTITVEHSHDQGKAADVMVSAPFPVAMDVHSSKDVTVIPNMPSGPPAPPDHQPAGPPADHHDSHHGGQHHGAAEPKPDDHQPEKPAEPKLTPQPEQPPAQPNQPPQPEQPPHPANPPQPEQPPQPANPPQPEQPPQPGSPTQPTQPAPDQPGIDPSLLPPMPHPADPNMPSLSDLLRPDPPKTGFEGQLAQGHPFEVPVRVHSDVDVSRITWLNHAPADLHRTRFEVVGDPSAHVTADEPTYRLTVDPAAIMPVRDPQTKELLGYRMRRGDTMFSFDRNGRLTNAGNRESPLMAPKADPIDVMMIAVDLGPIAAKGLAASAEAIAATFAKQAPKVAGEFVRGPTIARFGADEVELLSEYWEGRLAKETDADLRHQAEQALKALNERGRVRDWSQSEQEVAHIYQQIGGKGESAEMYQAADGTWKVTKPDFSGPNVRGEVKNWETVHIKSEDSANKLIDRLAAQVKARNNLPGPANIPGRTQQTVVLDLRGQALSEDNLQTIGHVLAERTGLPVENIQLIVWDK
ncbi:MAG: hypothetical protein HOU81_02550 [Hamadaea sp.]|uniref:hypothetical protein n=1 Tax=Hamadaea sp. TaxID=2024425 RepID=UPI0017D2A69F|nr:hypothetical protein [Hamadaea sp.]NUR69676.1 hypothetical protein [Hamadaea sp.]NUT19543.1 hypothetical protein [Hamadaea sp.]